MADQPKFDALNIQLLAISANNPFSQRTFAASLAIAYPLLSDHPDGTVIARYGMLKRDGETDLPVARGAYFLVDKHGVIRGKWMNPPGAVFPNETILDAAHEHLN
jgi:peroxiredoxin